MIRNKDILDLNKYSFAKQITSFQFKVLTEMDGLADFELGKVEINKVYRITTGMISNSQKQKIEMEISIFDNQDLREINSKDALFKVFQNYKDTDPIGYIIYTVIADEGIAYYFNSELYLLASKKIKNPKFKIEPLQILPTDWLKMRNEKYDNVETNLDKEFVDRTNFENFTIEKLRALENQIENALKININSDKLKAQLATLLMQNLPNSKRLEKASKLFSSITDKEIIEEYGEIKNTICEMLKPQQVKSTITRVNWGIFNRCPLTCRGCYNIFNSNVLPLEQCKQIVDKIANSGTSELIISGGDPLLWTDLVEFCQYAKSKGLKIGIDTVSYNLNKHLLYNLKDLISYIGIPLDGANQETMETFRKGKKDLFDQMLYSLELADFFDVPIRLNTTVSKRNIESLGDIAEIVERHKSIKTWSIYQWWSLRSGDKLVEQMMIDKAEFQGSIEMLRSRYRNIKIYDRSVDSRERNTFFISSNGEVYTFGKNSIISTFIIGDIKTQNIAEILKSPALKKNSQKFKMIERFDREKTNNWLCPSNCVNSFWVI